MATVFEVSWDELQEAREKITELKLALCCIVGCTHRPNPTDPTRIDVAPGQHRNFQAAIETAISLSE